MCQYGTNRNQRTDYRMGLSTTLAIVVTSLFNLLFLEQLSVTLTLTSSTTDSVNRVLGAIADLLKIAVPPVFEIHSRCGKLLSSTMAAYGAALSQLLSDVQCTLACCAF